jgi:hypothetical protein
LISAPPSWASRVGDPKGEHPLLRRVLIIVGWALIGAVAWAIIFGFSLLLDAEDPEDFLEQATFRTQKVVAVAGVAVADGHCGESKNNGVTQTHGTSYRVDVTWTGADGERHTGEMTTCEPPPEGGQVTVWVTSRDTVFNRSPLGMYSSVPIAAMIFALGAWGWTRITKKDRGAAGRSSGRSRVSRRLRRKLRRWRARQSR